MLLFLGAGASKRFEIPDTKGFIPVFEENKTILSNQIYMKLKESIGSEILDTEILMTILHDLSKPEGELMDSIAPHTSRFLSKQGADSQYYAENEEVKLACHDMLRTIKRIIRTTCLEQVRVKRQEILESYDAFFGAFDGVSGRVGSQDGSGKKYPELAIFTTNYDTCLETYFNMRKVHHSRGLVIRYGEVVFDGSTYLTQRSPLDFIKLHGSIDLFVKDRRVRFLPGAGAMDTRAITYLGEEYGPEFLIYPVESSVSAELLQSPFMELLNYFRNRLNDSKNWVIMGSTFRDFTLVSIMNDVIMNKDEVDYPTVLHINPLASSINEYILSKGYSYLAKVIKPIDYSFLDDNLVLAIKSLKLRE